MEWIEVSPSPCGTAGKATVSFPRSEPFFEGHFPQAPILPGVVLIDTAVSIISKVMKRSLCLTGLSSVKFIRYVEPGQEIHFEFTSTISTSEPAQMQVKGRWSRGADPLARMQFTVAGIQEKK